eukprot:GFUD01007942.1.p1 GENE.GFUD01007942.1~~GFUD01007942.1.p1  ORF type:complete len:485 (-),score=118.85 GFUD01007942.1:139-1593(-)
MSSPSTFFSCIAVPDGVKLCANCLNYSWTQLTNLMQCSRCKFINYCSAECQQEHWVKVHKRHCKYLAQVKVMPQSKHDPVFCLGCKVVRETGPVEMTKPDNPVLGCLFPPQKVGVPVLFQPDFDGEGGKEAPLPVQLGEMAGTFLTKAEHTVSIMTQILYKMVMTDHLTWTICPEECDAMMKMLIGLRHAVWHAYIFANSGHVLDKAIVGKFTCSPGFLLKINTITDTIDEKLAVARFSDNSAFKLWDTFKLFLHILIQFCTEPMRKEAETVGLPDVFDDVKRVTSAQFNNMWQQLLDSTGFWLVPYITLVEIVCGGQLEQICAACSKKITVSELLISAGDYKNTGVSSYLLGHIGAACCGHPRCFKKVSDDAREIVAVYMKISSENRANQCDFCGLPSTGKVHRCGKCLTKLYCGIQCRNDDWEKVHKIVCREEEVERKKKGGKQERNEVGRNVLSEVIETFVSEDHKLDEGQKEAVANIFRS